MSLLRFKKKIIFARENTCVLRGSLVCINTLRKRLFHHFLEEKNKIIDIPP